MAESTVAEPVGLFHILNVEAVRRGILAASSIIAEHVIFIRW